VFITHFKTLPPSYKPTHYHENHYNRHWAKIKNKKQKKWGKGINIDSNNINITNINNFMQFKTLEYKVYDFKDNELWEAYKEDFQNFIL